MLAHQLEQLHRIRLGEGRLECQQFIQREPQAIDIAAHVGMAMQTFGRHILQGADHIAGAREIALFEHLGQPEVGDPSGAGTVDQQVGRLDIAMQDALRMGIVERFGHLHADRGDLVPIAGQPNRAGVRRQLAATGALVGRGVFDGPGRRHGDFDCFSRRIARVESPGRLGAEVVGRGVAIGPARVRKLGASAVGLGVLGVVLRGRRSFAALLSRRLMTLRARPMGSPRP